MKISDNYLKQNKQIEALFRWRYRDPEERLALAQQLSSRLVDPQLIEILKQQSSELAPSRAREKQIERLQKPGTLAVVTGQQTGLYLGPLFTLYKACSAIALAKQLELELQRPVVPIFWIQNEDHDFPEINHTFLPSSSQAPIRVAVEATSEEPDNAKVSVHYQKLPPSILTSNEVVTGLLNNLPGAERFVLLINKYYQPGVGISEAFRQLLADLFSEEGLIVFHPRSLAVAELTAPLMERALLEQEAITALLEQRSSALAALELEPQVAIRSNSPLWFCHPHGEEGPRYRLERDGNTWRPVGRLAGISSEQIREWLRQKPLRFSSSALFRPILQDSLFPTVAYIAGPGEINYWAQIRPLYQHFGLTMPLVIPRASYLVVDDKLAKLCSQLNLGFEDLLDSDEDLERKLAGNSGSYPRPEELFGEANAKILSDLGQVSDALTIVDPTLSQAFSKSRDKFLEQMEGLRGRYQTALLRVDTTRAERIQRLRQTINPEGIQQERFYSALLGMAVWPNLKELAVENFDLTGKVKVLKL